MNRGEIWWFEEPKRGRRPVCVLTRQEAIPVLRRVVVAPATRTIRGSATEVALSSLDGMPEPCVLSLDNVRTVSRPLLVHRITALSQPRMREVCTALNLALGC